MADIFISYARVDRERARALASALDGEGWTVWWDRGIPPGRTFDDVIEEALGAAKCVIVLWSRDSVRSEWVRSEASDAARRRLLVPVLIEDVTPPLEFRRLQSAALFDWANLPANPDWSHLCKSLGALVGRLPSSVANDAPKRAERAAPPAPAVQSAGGRKWRPAIVAASVIVVVAGTGWAVVSRPSGNPQSRAPEPLSGIPSPPERTALESNRQPAEATAGVPAVSGLTSGSDGPRSGGPRVPARDTAPPVALQSGRIAPDARRESETAGVRPGPGSEAPAGRGEFAPAALPARTANLVPAASPSAAPSAVSAPAAAQATGETAFDVTYTRGVFRESGRLTVSSEGLRYAEAAGRSGIDAACGDVRRVQVPTVIVDREQRMVELQLRDRVLRFTLTDTPARNRLVSALSQVCGAR